MMVLGSELAIRIREIAKNCEAMLNQLHLFSFLFSLRHLCRFDSKRTRNFSQFLKYNCFAPDFKRYPEPWIDCFLFGLVFYVCSNSVSSTVIDRLDYFKIQLQYPLYGRLRHAYAHFETGLRLNLRVSLEFPIFFPHQYL